MTGPILDMRNSMGCAYSHVKPIGARKRWCFLWIYS